jgi:ABC-2 type transport system permease protein
MRGLLASEFLRFRSRRLVVILFIGTLVGTTVGLVIAAVQSTRPTDAVVAAARARAQEEVAKCLAADFGDGNLGMPIEDFCRRNFSDPNQYMPSHLALVDLPEILEGVSSLPSILGLVIGASFVAGSWQTGTITTILTWEPRRLRWFVARVIVLTVGVFVVTALMVVFLSAALALAAMLRGSTVGVGADWWADVLTTSLRVSVAAAVSAVIGGAVAAVGRHTAAALGVVFIWTAVIEGLIRGLRPLWSPWLLGDNLASFLGWVTTNYQVSTFESYTITPGRAIFVILGYTAVLLGLGFIFVRIRDVQ